MKKIIIHCKFDGVSEGCEDVATLEQVKKDILDLLRFDFDSVEITDLSMEVENE